MKRLLVLAMATSIAAFAQETPSNTQEQPSAQTSFITDELTGNKVFETGAKEGAANDQAAQSSGGAPDGEQDQKEQSTASTEKPKTSSGASKSTSKSSTSQKKTQGSKSSTSTNKKTTTSSSKKSTNKSSPSKKTSGTSSKSTSKKSTTKSSGSKTSGGKKSTQGKSTTKSTTTSDKTQSAAKPSGETQQEKQNVQDNGQSTVQNPTGNPSAEQQPQMEHSQGNSLPASGNTPQTNPQNLKTQEGTKAGGEPQEAALPPSPSVQPSAGALTGALPQPSSPAAPDAPQDESDAPQLEAKPKTPSPTLSVSMKNSQYLDVTYPEGGWIFLGEEGEKPLLRYFGRKIAGDVTSFSLRSRAEGKTVLHFYKNTADGVIDDYIEVEIKGKNETQERVKAMPYTPQPAKTTGADTAVPQARTQSEGGDIGSVDLPQPDEAAEVQVGLFAPMTDGGVALLHEAKRLAHLEDYDEALRLLDEFLDGAQQNADEALFLQAQIFEVSQEQKNIRGALDCYETIVRRYPESSLWEKANERAVYLKKFYFDIR